MAAVDHELEVEEAQMKIEKRLQFWTQGAAARVEGEKHLGSEKNSRRLEEEFQVAVVFVAAAGVGDEQQLARQQM